MSSFQILTAKRMLRDMRWMLSSPGLLQGDERVNVLSDAQSRHYYDDTAQLFAMLQDSPEPLARHIAAQNFTRLGKYFEALWFYWMRQSGLFSNIKTNVVVSDNAATLGELDALCHQQDTGVNWHWELADKYYLHVETEQIENDFVGPNPLDRFVDKCDRLFNHQLPLARDPKSKTHVKDFQPLTSSAIVKGYLFYHPRALTRPTSVGPYPLADAHLRGWWIRLDELDFVLAKKDSFWCILERPLWIAPFSSEDDLDVKTLDTNDLIRVLENMDNAHAKPLLVAELVKSDDDTYHEVSRGFVVNSTWPNLAQKG